MASLSGQVALVTGASTGIGRHLVEGLAARGMAVAGVARTEDRLRTAMAEVAEATGARTLAVAADVTGRASVEAAVAEVVAELGQVDLLVNNAGLIDEFEVPVWEADADQWWEVVSSHIRGAQLTIRALVPWMVLRNRGRVVNIASGMSTRANPDYSAYSVAKTGLLRLTESLATALEGSDVRAFDVAPGVVDTPMTRSMHMWQGFTDWTPPERVVELVAAIAAGELDQWSGRFLRAGADDLEDLRAVPPEGAARQLRLRPHGDTDPLG
ncbi:SDR family NAD(P)-dependent oxidoreductase [Blastococcus saxobsidens]|uniref:Short-chain dehydrogenase/reductase SDR n=1 Tax=Blastococcus saxobsidens (strain DD2) TaxID=1146883 RepID=H6RWC7_BLASD|nr:SDR family oxidoreductase [Blastococcus saxobsidens]CCG03342.1 Short-chain dehydrogenase/reductase SDR [Blastococcus saxobsidens DD2]